MKIQLFILLFIGFAYTAKAQINMADSTVRAITYWNLNESENYRISQKNFQSTNGEVTKNDSTSFDVKVTVIDSTENSYTVKWEFSNYKIPFIDLLPTLKQSLESKRFIYKTNELGELQELLNWEEVRDNLLETTRISTELALKGTMDTLSITAKDSLNKIMEIALRPLKSRNYIETKVIEQVTLFHSFMGAEYKLGEMIETEMETPNSMDPSKNFNSHVKLWLDIISEEDHYYAFRYEQIVDGEELMNFVKSFMASLSASFGTELDKDESLKYTSMDYSTRNYTAMDDWGWPIYILHTVNVSLGDHLTRTVTTSIEILE